MKQLYETTYNGDLHSFEGYFEELMLPVEGGALLYTQIFRKAQNQKGPILLMRNCYCTDAPRPEVMTSDCGNWVEAGYIVVIQHCRGTGRSNGTCTMYAQERNDGLQLLEWIRQQPFYDHEIYLSGGSYLSSVHFAWINVAGDDIKGAILAVQDCVRYNILYRNGFYKSGLHGQWMQKMYKKNMDIARNFTADSFRTMPLTRFTENVFGENIPFIQEEFKHPRQDDPYWETTEGGCDFTHALDHLAFPVLFITSFYDIYLDGVLKMWDALPEDARAKCALLVTPYDHAFEGTSPVIKFENTSLNTIWPNYRLDWCNAVREKRLPHFVVPGNTTFYTQFANKWTTVPRLENGPNELQFYFGKHTLSRQKESCPPITYLYDPYNPASFKGGCCNTFGGQQLQDAPDSRYDIHSFITPPAEQPVVLQGTGKLLLTVSSDCEDTCFYARLSHIHADGSCYGMRDDIIALRSQTPEYHPGEKKTVVLNFAPNAIRIQPGESLRIDISSSNFPAFIPHRNTTENYWEATSAQPARNTIYLEESTLVLHTL